MISQTRCAVYHAPRDIRIEERELPAREPGGLLVETVACGLCTGEVMDWYMAKKAPFTPGHEIVARVIEGDGIAPGTLIALHHHAACGQCPTCLRGDDVHCGQWRSSRLNPGGLSERIVVPPEIATSDVVALDGNRTVESYVLTEPLACAIKSLRRARFEASDRLVIVGLGAMGLLHALVAQRMGARSIAGIDLNPVRLAFARDLGIAALHPTERSDVKGDVVVVCPGSQAVLDLGIRLTAPGGRVVLFTPLPPEDRWPVDAHKVYFDEISLIPSYSAGAAEFVEAVRMIEAGLPTDRLVTHRLALDEVQRGYDLVREANEAIKVVIEL